MKVKRKPDGYLVVQYRTSGSEPYTAEARLPDVDPVELEKALAVFNANTTGGT